MVATASQEVKSFSEARERFINKINNMPKAEALEYIDSLLIEAGILDENGKEKEQIVTGDFFGW